MHEIRISASAKTRQMRTKGKEFAFEQIDLARTAHLIIDMQNGFLEPGAPIEVPVARDIVDNVNAISAAVRDAGGLNVFFRFTVDPADGWSVYLTSFGGENCRDGAQLAFRPGGHHHAVYPGIDVCDGDVVMNKTRFSAFTAGSSPIAELLAKRGIDTVIITGTLTNCCCESTARDANQLNFKVIFISDGTAAVSDDDHNAALNSLAPVFADVTTTRRALRLISNPLTSAN
ncbi:ureidoacrylate peracid hydrolase [Antricoccus suffuscus]|uniref:Ureidoacrylate peracid hydrolase n=1 Tax=Antricoccus suffuscus TaxID=1629062 RepID=A0A2T0YZI2_9ACTN|nr:cysteine hydrolase [Antricoccus suffuscus]PRZ29493.1 ureidoacrylate peracid hydrolase [Antricoccus suffuscus]